MLTRFASALLLSVASIAMTGCGPDNSTTVSAPPAPDQVVTDPSVYSQNSDQYYNK